MISIQDKKIIIATHYLLYGAAQALRDYLTDKKITKLLCISLPLITQRQTFFVSFEHGHQTNEKIIQRGKGLSVLDYIIDFVLTVWFILFNDVGFSVHEPHPNPLLRREGRNV